MWSLRSKKAWGTLTITTLVKFKKRERGQTICDTKSRSKSASLIFLSRKSPLTRLQNVCNLFKKRKSHLQPLSFNKIINQKPIYRNKWGSIILRCWFMITNWIHKAMVYAVTKKEDPTRREVGEVRRQQRQPETRSEQVATQLRRRSPASRRVIEKRESGIGRFRQERGRTVIVWHVLHKQRFLWSLIKTNRNGGPSRVRGPNP